MPNRSALILAALIEVGAVASGQPASAEDVAAVDARVDPMLADLAARGIAYVADADAIEDAIFSHLLRILAEHVAPMFGRPTDWAVIEEAERRLRVIANVGRGSRRTLRVDAMLARRWR